MTPRLVFISMAIAIGSTASPVLAQDTERYQIERTDDGYVRLDTVTGRMSICRERGDQLVCRYATDESRAYVDDIEALRARVDALEQRLAAVEEESVPSEEEFEQGLNHMEGFMRRFMGIMQDFDRRFGGDEPPPADAPDRT